MARKAFLFARLAAALLVASSASAGSAQSSGAGGALFEQIKAVLLGRVDPDAIEMARFSIAHPEEAATIYTRAAANDYPFFGLIGAVKAARGADDFTHDQCMVPITSIDAVFAKASDHVTQGAAQTESATHAASSIANEYAQAQSDQAKQQLVERLSQTVPYFADIGTICDFAFETDFQIENDIQRVAGQVSQDIRAAYYAFEAGDVVTGVDLLMSLGAGKAVACQMVDNAVGGGVIGRTPILGALAKNACSGFAGLVFDGFSGLINGGVGLGEAGLTALANGTKAAACAVYSLIGNGCSSAEPPPPATAFQNAVAWCTPHGGIAGFSSGSNQPDDYYLICNDNSQCSARPGTVAQCATGAEIAAREAQEVALAEAEFQSRLPQWQAGFVARWDARCPDQGCRTGIRIARLNAVNLATSEHVARPRMAFQTLTYFIFEAADRQAVTVVEDTSYRVLPLQWAQRFQSRWRERCEDEQCRVGIMFVSTNALAGIHQNADATPRPPYGSNAAFYWAAEDQASAVLAESVQRMIAFNINATANIAATWRALMADVWGRRCSDHLCFLEVNALATAMGSALIRLQAMHPEENAQGIFRMVGPASGAKIKAAVDRSRVRVAAAVMTIPVFTGRPVGPIRPFLQPGRGPLARWAVLLPALRPRTGGRPPPRPVPVVRPVTAAPAPAGRPAPSRIAPARPAPTPRPPRPIVIPRS